MLTEHEFMRKIAPKSPLKRPKYRGFLRNVSVVMGNQQRADFLPALNLARERHCEDPMLVHHLDWAISRCQNTQKGHTAHAPR